MRQGNGFESWRQVHLHFVGGHRAQQFSLLRTITQPTWDTSTKQFTKQYYKWLEDIGRVQWDNKTTFDEVHQWISNYFNSTYTGAEDDKGQIGNINEKTEKQEEWYNDENNEYYGYEGFEEYNDQDVKYIIQMVNKGKGKRKGKNKGKGKGDKGGKDSKTVTCYTCGQQGHILPNCPTKKGKGKAKGSQSKGQWYDGKGSWQPQPQSYQQGYS
eukprot:2744145-Amphidinium_carterae.1